MGKKRHLHREKFLLFFFILLTFFSQVAPAQKETSLERIPTPETDVFAPPIENSAPVFSIRPPVSDGAEKIDETRWRKPLEDVSENSFKTEIKKLDFESRDDWRAPETAGFRSSTLKDLEKSRYRAPKPYFADKDAEDYGAAGKRESFNWRGAFSQSFIFLGVQHGYALVFQEKTRRALKGKFWKDYGGSVKALRGWDDGNRFFTNYIAHPMQGALTGFIYVQNSPQARRQQFGKSKAYWNSRMKAMLWTTAWSTQFEIGPISQASIGNVGLYDKQTWVDLVITPTVGTGVMIGEDALDRYLLRTIERRTNNFWVKIFMRMLFNPTRNFSNMLRFKEPWYRDRPPGS